jgi:hypothetical protein
MPSFILSSCALFLIVFQMFRSKKIGDSSGQGKTDIFVNELFYPSFVCVMLTPFMHAVFVG